jgi:ribosomal-protein-alanine N-acetyltransferase
MFQKLPNIQSGRLSLTPIQESDLEDLGRIYSNPVHFRWTPDTSTKNKETLRKRIGHFQRDFDKKKRLFLALRLDGKLIGVLEAFDYKKRSASVTIGYRLHEDVWNQGLASKALSLFCNYLTTACQLQTIHAFVLPENQASQKVLEKNDFRLQGHVTENWKGHE